MMQRTVGYLITCGVGAALSLTSGPVAAQPADAACSGLTFGSGRRAICLPQGESSFADEVVSFTPGARPSSGVFAEATYALGLPDYTNTRSPGFLSLGCDGVLVLRFTDNALVDVDGPDLYVFEVGPAVEPTVLAISEDGRTWTEVGRIEGARADVDIAPFVTPSQTFTYVRLTNASRTCGGRHSGADIDAVAAVGSALRLSLDGAVLFDTGQATLKPEALEALSALLPKIKAYGTTPFVTVEGHTDDVGEQADNQKLSEARAAAVAAYLAEQLGVSTDRVSATGHGEGRPVAPNDSAENRAKNRRVDILVRPGR
jgi:outer membrane protein OmpA-like peptidoglycan-associated protein